MMGAYFAAGRARVGSNKFLWIYTTDHEGNCQFDKLSGRYINVIQPFNLIPSGRYVTLKQLNLDMLLSTYLLILTIHLMI